MEAAVAITPILPFFEALTAAAQEGLTTPTNFSFICEVA